MRLVLRPARALFTTEPKDQSIMTTIATAATRDFVLPPVPSRRTQGLEEGLPAALYAGHLMQNQLYGVGSYDPWALAGAPLALLVCAAAAGFIPARRAASIDPMKALRTD